MKVSALFLNIHHYYLTLNVMKAERNMYNNTVYTLYGK